LKTAYWNAKCEKVSHFNWSTKVGKGIKLEHRLAAYSIFVFCFFVFLFTIYIIAERTEKNSQVSPFGVDFGVYYTAGQMVRSGETDDLYNIPVHHAALERIMDREMPFYLPWMYPPTFLMIVTPFSFLPYTTALVVWLSITLALALFALFPLVPKRKSLALLVVGFPGVLMNLRWGQNGFLNTALLGFGLYFLESNPVLAGLMFGLLTYKPQIALFAFLVLFISKKWRVLSWAVVFTVGFAILSGVLFGFDTWVQFVQSFSNSTSGLLDNNWLSIAKVQPSMFINLRLAGIIDSVNYIILGVIGLVVAGATGWVWHHTDRIALKAATMCAGTLLVIPYFLQYDLMILSIPLVLLSYDYIEYGRRPIDFLLLLAFWMTPLLDWLLVRWTDVHICPFILMALILSVVMRVKRQFETEPAMNRIEGKVAEFSDDLYPQRETS